MAKRSEEEYSKGGIDREEPAVQKEKLDTDKQMNDVPAEELSMSQLQNRTEGGRENNGSDGTGKGRGSNH